MVSLKWVQTMHIESAGLWQFYQVWSLFSSWLLCSGVGMLQSATRTSASPTNVFWCTLGPWSRTQATVKVTPRSATPCITTASVSSCWLSSARSQASWFCWWKLAHCTSALWTPEGFWETSSGGTSEWSSAGSSSTPPPSSAAGVQRLFLRQWSCLTQLARRSSMWSSTSCRRSRRLHRASWTASCMASRSTCSTSWRKRRPGTSTPRPRYCAPRRNATPLGTPSAQAPPWRQARQRGPRLPNEGQQRSAMMRRFWNLQHHSNYISAQRWTECPV